MNKELIFLIANNHFGICYNDLKANNCSEIKKEVNIKSIKAALIEAYTQGQIANQVSNPNPVKSIIVRICEAVLLLVSIVMYAHTIIEWLINVVKHMPK